MFADWAQKSIVQILCKKPRNLIVVWMIFLPNMKYWLENWKKNILIHTLNFLWYNDMHLRGTEKKVVS